MSFCALCKKNVAMPEQRKACGKVFHMDCFTCGCLDKDSGACGKKLTLDTYEDGKGSPFCKICYGKFFGPKGFIGGTVAFNTFDEVPQQHNFVNDRNLKGIQIEQKDLPTSGTMAAAMAAYKKEAVNA